MKFHTLKHPDTLQPWPIVLGHFVPWYTLRGADYPLLYAETTTLEPSRDYGRAPLERCLHFIKEARGLVAANA
jgi:hypothetical protein